MKQLSQKLNSGISLRKIILLISFRGLGVVFQLLMQFAIARIAGPAGIGIMQLYQTWSCVLGEISALGLPTQAMKSISISRQREQIQSRLKGSIKIISQCWLVAVLLIALFSLLPMASMFSGWIPFSLGCKIALLWSVLCFAILRLSAEALKAMNLAGEAIFAENSLLPVSMLLYCACVALGVFSDNGLEQFSEIKSQFNPENLVYAATVFLTMATAYSLSRSYYKATTVEPALGEELAKNPRTETSSSVSQDAIFKAETGYFWGSSVINIGFLSLPFLLMPYFGELAAIGLFTLAFKFINPITTILGMLNALFGPSFAKAKAAASESESESESDTKNSKGLFKLLLQSQLLSTALYLPILVPILIFSDEILGLFGERFVEAKVYLFILSGAQLVNAITGLSGNMLNMVGMGKREFQGAIVFFILGLITGIYAGFEYGLIGIAIAYSLAFAGKNIWSYSFAIAYICKRKATENTSDYKLA